MSFEEAVYRNVRDRVGTGSLLIISEIVYLMRLNQCLYVLIRCLCFLGPRTAHLAMRLPLATRLLQVAMVKS